jgi:membrane fusion protein, heavy metal efflux system
MISPSFALARKLRLCVSALLAILFIGPHWVHAGPGAHGPGGEHLDVPATGTPSGLARLSDGSVNVPKLAQRRMELRTVLAPESDAVATIELPGRVIADPNAGGRIQAVHGGRVEPGTKGLPVAGQVVRRGEILAYVRHHADPYTKAAQEAQLAELRANQKLAVQRVARLESLEGTVPRKDIEAARAELTSLTERERSTGASIAAREALLSPVNGVIARADAIGGQVVEPKDVLFEVIDPARLMIEATATDMAIASRIESASIADVATVKLSVAGVGRSLRDGVFPVTLRIMAGGKNNALPLAVGQPVTVIAELRDRTKGIVLPAKAIVRNTSNEPVVWIKVSAERYLPQPVQFQLLDAQTVLVTKGLAADNRVVVQGASLIAQIR